MCHQSFSIRPELQLVPFSSCLKFDSVSSFLKDVGVLRVRFIEAVAVLSLRGPFRDGNSLIATMEPSRLALRIGNVPLAISALGGMPGGLDSLTDTKDLSDARLLCLSSAITPGRPCVCKDSIWLSPKSYPSHRSGCAVVQYSCVFYQQLVAVCGYHLPTRQTSTSLYSISRRLCPIPPTS
jgi:hypothetical protein